MLADIKEEQKNKLPKIRKHRSVSKLNKLNRSPSTKITDISRKKHQSPAKKRTHPSSKSTKDERRYQHFVKDLNNDM
jgi:hypothetical protein